MLNQPLNITLHEQLYNTISRTISNYTISKLFQNNFQGKVLFSEFLVLNSMRDVIKGCIDVRVTLKKHHKIPKFQLNIVYRMFMY